MDIEQRNASNFSIAVNLLSLEILSFFFVGAAYNWKKNRLWKWEDCLCFSLLIQWVWGRYQVLDEIPILHFLFIVWIVVVVE